MTKLEVMLENTTEIKLKEFFCSRYIQLKAAAKRMYVKAVCHWDRFLGVSGLDGVTSTKGGKF